MNLKFPFLAVLTFFPLILFSQNLYKLSIEELEEMLDTVTLDEKRVKVYNELAYKLLDVQIDQAKVYTNRAMQIADTIKDSLGKSYSLVTLGLITKREQTPILAEAYFLEALELRKKNGDVKKTASVYNNLGLLFEESDAVKAEKYYKLGLQELKLFPEVSIKAILYNNYGNFLTKQQRFIDAYQQLESSLIIRRKKKAKKSLGNSYLNLAKYYFEINDTSKFQLYIDSSLMAFTIVDYSLGKSKCYNLLGKFTFSEKRYSQAIRNFQNAILLAGNSLNDYFLSLKNLAAVKVKQGDLDEAFNINQECLSYFKQVNNKREIAIILVNTGTIFYEKRNYEQAKTYYLKALEKLETVNDIAVKSKALLLLSASYAYLGNVRKSADINRVYLEILDLHYQNKNKSLNVLLDDSDLLLQNAKLKTTEVSHQLKQEKEKKEKIKTYAFLIVGIIFFLFLLATSLAAVYRQKKQIADLRINDLLADKERTTNYARLEEQESERNRIAKDLHDRLGSMLTAIKFSMGSMESTLTDIKEENKISYSKVSKLIDEACDEVRNIAHNLKNSTLANFGLRTALEFIAESFEGKTPRIKFQIHNLNTRLNNKIEVNVYLIIQEIISNTLKHAKAKNLNVQINRFENVLNITAEDDGIGFVREKVKPGMGLNNIEARVYGLNGSFNLDSGKNHGTTIMIDIPLESKNI